MTSSPCRTCCNSSDKWRLGCEGPNGLHDGVSPNWLIELVYHRDAGSPAVDRDAPWWDLYGYTSMLVPQSRPKVRLSPSCRASWRSETPVRVES